MNSDRLIRVVFFLSVFFAHYSLETQAWRIHVGASADPHVIEDPWAVLSPPLFVWLPPPVESSRFETLLLTNSLVWAAVATWLSSLLPVRRLLRRWAGQRTAPVTTPVARQRAAPGAQRSPARPGARSFGNGRYEVIARIGGGAFASVYRARDHVRELDVAIKTPNLHVVPPPQRASFRAAFQREASLAGRLDHHGIVAVFDHDADAEEPYIVMALVKGGTLRQRLDALPPGQHIDWLEAVEIGVQVAAALDYARRHGVKVHRDIKPANIFRGDSGYKVGDFGIVSARAEEQPVSILQAGGTSGYMAPEQMLTPRAIDWRADLFSLCAVLYEALTGTPPFGGGRARRPGVEPAAIPSIVAAANAQLTPLRDLAPDVPPHLAAAIERGLQFDRARRFTSWDEFVDALRGETRAQE